jgi:hypothetical protein
MRAPYLATAHFNDYHVWASAPVPHEIAGLNRQSALACRCQQLVPIELLRERNGGEGLVASGCQAALHRDQRRLAYVGFDVVNKGPADFAQQLQEEIVFAEETKVGIE